MPYCPKKFDTWSCESISKWVHVNTLYEKSKLALWDIDVNIPRLNTLLQNPISEFVTSKFGWLFTYENLPIINWDISKNKTFPVSNNRWHVTVCIRNTKKKYLSSKQNSKNSLKGFFCIAFFCRCLSLWTVFRFAGLLCLQCSLLNHPIWHIPLWHSTKRERERARKKESKRKNVIKKERGNIRNREREKKKERKKERKIILLFYKKIEAIFCSYV